MMVKLERISSVRMHASGFDVTFDEKDIDTMKGVRGGEIELLAQIGSAPVNIECWDGDIDDDEQYQGNTELCFTIEEAETLHDALGKIIEHAKEMNKIKDK